MQKKKKRVNLADQYRSEHDRALAKAFNITDRDLKANREGILSENQKKLLFGRSIHNILFCIVALILVTGMTYILSETLSEIIVDGAGNQGLYILPFIAGGIGGFASLGGLGFEIRNLSKIRTSIREGVVICETETIAIRKPKSEYMGSGRNQALWKTTTYSAVIGGKPKSLNARLYRILKNGKPYHFYYTTGTGILVAMELAE